MRILGLSLFLSLLLSAILEGQVTVSPWQVHKGTQGIIKLDSKLSEFGDPKAYEHKKIPNENDSGWKSAKMVNGLVHFNEKSGIGDYRSQDCKKKLDFTYFQTIVDVPKNVNISTFNISYDKADDGARIYFFNADGKEHYDPKADLKFVINEKPKTGKVDLKHLVKPGKNRVVIVQFDCCGGGNTVEGIHIKVNGKEIIPAKEVTLTPWQIHEGTQNIIELDSKLSEFGDPRAYQHKKIPNENDSGWKLAKMVNDKVQFNERSAIGDFNSPDCKKKLDFTYFQTTVDVPENGNLSTFTVSYDKADDGARIYFFGPDGKEFHEPKADLKFVPNQKPKTGTVDLKHLVKPGKNRVVIVQFDCCGGGNTVEGIHINVNGKKIKTTK